jgi:hypothetical protein
MPLSGAIITYNTQTGESVTEGGVEVPDPDPTKGRALNHAEFLRVGNKTDAVKFNTLLKEMPSALPLLADYADVRGIDYGDATNAEADNDTRDLLTAAVAAEILTEQDVTDFFAKWVELFPEGS